MIKYEYKNNIIYTNRKTCRLCDSDKLFTWINLEPTALANKFVKNPIRQPIIPLDVCICKDCNHIQLIQIVDETAQYCDYFYVSSTTEIMINHLKKNILHFIKSLNINKSDNILEIGANDGVCIKYLLENDYNNILGIDPASNIKERHNLPIICDFFGSNSYSKISKIYQKYKLIYAFHCCAHIENINDVFETIYKLLDDEGTFIMEVGYFYSVFKTKTFDVIYHEHIDYHTCTAIQKFVSKHNLFLYDIKENNIQGGSIQFFICKNTFKNKPSEYVLLNLDKEKESGIFDIPSLINWSTDINNIAISTNNFINNLVHNENKIVVGYGASAKSVTFLYKYKLNSTIIKFIIDDNIYKQNHYSPGLHIPIENSDILKKENVDYIIILSWNFRNEIIKNIKKINNDIKIIIPFPELIII